MTLTKAESSSVYAECKKIASPKKGSTWAHDSVVTVYAKCKNVAPPKTAAHGHMTLSSNC
jgi:hypothetical protein